MSAMVIGKINGSFVVSSLTTGIKKVKEMSLPERVRKGGWAVVEQLLNYATYHASDDVVGSEKAFAEAIWAEELLLKKKPAA